MDSSTIDHSDSDSGESWTIIENDSNNAKLESEITEHAPESIAVDNDKDEDTDGISIITDSEPDSTPCQINCEHSLHEEDCTQMLHIPELIDLNHEPEKENDDFLSESGRNTTWNRKTYVHRRNKRLSTVLDIIMLGSVIITAGVAIGHIWGAKTDCSTQAPTNVNKILSNLYKLQEENAYLWSKLKELTALNNYQMTQHKTTLKQNKCKKMFEEPLINNDVKRVTRCVDDKFFNSENLMNSPMVEAAKNEKSDEFLNETEDLTNEQKSYAESLEDFEKSKTNKYIYDNKKIKKPYESVIDSSFTNIDSLVHINKEKSYLKTNKNEEGDHGYKLNVEDKNSNRDSSQQNDNKTLKEKERKVSGHEFNNKKDFTKTKVKNNGNKTKAKYTVGRKEINTPTLSNYKKEDTEKNIIQTKDNDFKKDKKFNEDNVQQIDSEEDVKKDDRYVNQKQKPKLKKNGKHQTNKKNKKRNKYEQWEMKGGLIRDYDDVSLDSSQDKEYLFNKPNLMNDKMYIHQSGHNNNIDNNFEAKTNNLDDEYFIDDSKNIKTGNEKDDINWLEKRARLRKEARLKLEQDSLSKNGVNAAGWYFRRMHKREQSRGKNDNSTYRKSPKPTINYKLKH